jgi:hypothetical protein
VKRVAVRLFILALLCGTYAYANTLSVKPMGACGSCSWSHGCCLGFYTCGNGICDGIQ